MKSDDAASKRYLCCYLQFKVLEKQNASELSQLGFRAFVLLSSITVFFAQEERFALNFEYDVTR